MNEERAGCTAHFPIRLSPYDGPSAQRAMAVAIGLGALALPVAAALARSGAATTPWDVPSLPSRAAAATLI